MGMQMRLKALYAPKLVVDGFWGPVSQAACRVYLRSLMPEGGKRWPAANERALRKFYGPPGVDDRLERIAVPYGMEYEGRVVKTMMVHERCAESLLRVLVELGEVMSGDDEVRAAVTDFAGVYNPRRMRGGSGWSLHAYGAAIDLDADENGLRDAWPLRATMPLRVMEAFAREGWMAAGAFWGYDAMHFQATR